MKFSEAEFPANFDIGDYVKFLPMAVHMKAMGITREPREGQVIAVRFSAAKVWYDIVDDYRGELFKGVDSSYVERSAFMEKYKPLFKESGEDLSSQIDKVKIGDVLNYFPSDSDRKRNSYEIGNVIKIIKTHNGKEFYIEFPDGIKSARPVKEDQIKSVIFKN